MSDTQPNVIFSLLIFSWVCFWHCCQLMLLSDDLLPVAKDLDSDPEMNRYEHQFETEHEDLESKSKSLIPFQVYCNATMKGIAAFSPETVTELYCTIFRSAKTCLLMA